MHKDSKFMLPQTSSGLQNRYIAGLGLEEHAVAPVKGFAASGISILSLLQLHK